MAKLNFALICARTIIDKTSNTLSIIDVIEQLTIKTPAEAAGDAEAVLVLQAPMEFMVDFSRSEATVPEVSRVRVRIISPTNVEIGGNELDLDMQAPLRTRAMMKLTGFPVSSEGVYIFDVQLLDPKANNWLPITQVPLPVIIDRSAP